jgi:hypothetical protein
VEILVYRDSIGVGSAAAGRVDAKPQ